MTYKTRKRLALVLLLVWLPLFVVVATTIMGDMERPHILVELGIYIGLGLVWALPFRAVFRGIGRDDPDAAPAPEETSGAGERPAADTPAGRS